MMKISNPVLAPANDQAVYISEGSLMHLDANFDEGRLLLEDVAGASHVRWSLDGEYVAFILNGRLQIVTVSTKQLVEVPLQNVIQFEWGAERIESRSCDTLLPNNGCIKRGEISANGESTKRRSCRRG